MMLVRLGAAAALFMLLAESAQAAEGLLEINQTCSVQTGCFPGDAPGFPVTISSAGGYLLTSELDAPTDGPAIDIQASAVDLDLNGQHVTSANSP